MFELKNEKIAIPVVLFAGLLWSFGPLVVRHMDEPGLVPWQYIFARGLTIFAVLNLYLYFEEGKNFYKNYLRIGISGLIGGCGLGVAMVTELRSTHATIALRVANGLSADMPSAAEPALLRTWSETRFALWLSLALVFKHLGKR